MSNNCILFLACMLQLLALIAAFSRNGMKVATYGKRQLSEARMTMSTVPITKKALLDKSTFWRISLTLSKSGFKSIENIAIVRFIEDRNYEPPQGRIFVEDDFNGLIRVDDKGYAGTWALSEDRDDRKDGLWIWGLFQEPKYPFLYFSLGIFKSIILPSGQEEPIFGGEGVPNDRLNIRMAHVRDPSRGALLTNGGVDYQLTEMVKADPFGVGGTINVGDKVVAGTIEIRPVFKDDAEKDAKSREELVDLLSGDEPTPPAV